MFQQILDALKTKFPGVSETILRGIAEKLAKTATTEEAVTTAVEGVAFQQILDSYGDSRATQASSTAVANYEKKYSIKEGKPLENPVPPATPPASAGENAELVKALAAMNETMKSLSTEITSIKTEKVTDERQAQLTAIIGKLPEALQKPYARMSVKDLSDEDFTATLAEVEKEVTDTLAHEQSKGAAMPFPKSGNSTPAGKPSAEEVNAMAESIMKV